MTDRHAGYVVVLDHDIREDDAEPTLAAIRQIKGVVSVKPIVAEPGIMLAEARARIAVIGRVEATLAEILRESDTMDTAARGRR